MSLRFLLFGLIAASVVIAGVWALSDIALGPSRLDAEDIVELARVEFAWEPVPFGDEHYFNREKFERELSITYFATYQVRLYHKRLPLYFWHIEKKLAQAWVPDDFKYLAIAESALINTAVSSASAGGIWQFIPETARRYGLRVDEFVDERFHFEKATDAAIAYLSDLHQKFDDWTLAAAAYNRGENGLQRALDAQGVDSYYDLYLNEETSRYIFRILAIKYVLENRDTLYEAHELGEPFSKPETHTIMVEGPIDIATLGRDLGLSYASVKFLNPWILSDRLPEWVWEIRTLHSSK